MKQQHHTFEIFSANCPLCKHIVEDIEFGRCEGSKQIVYDVNNMTEDIKIVGIPDFHWKCGGEELFQRLKRYYTFHK